MECTFVDDDDDELLMQWWWNPEAKSSCSTWKYFIGWREWRVAWCRQSEW